MTESNIFIFSHTKDDIQIKKIKGSYQLTYFRDGLYVSVCDKNLRKARELLQQRLASLGNFF